MSLRLVRNPRLALHNLLMDSLRWQADRLFPNSPIQANRWIRAKLYLRDRKPLVEIGIARVDTSRAPRSLKEAMNGGQR